MSVKLVALQYTYLFDPSESFSHLYQFEDMFSGYLKSIGYQAEEIKNVSGTNGQRMLLISKLEPIVQNVNPTTVVKEPPKMTLTELRDPKSYG